MPKYLHEFRNEIAGYDDKLSKLHDVQYQVMVYEQDGKKLDRLAVTQSNLEKAKATLEDEYYSAMGIGNEGKSGSEREGNNPNYSYDNGFSIWERDKYKMLPDKGFYMDRDEEEITSPNGEKVKMKPDKGFNMDRGNKRITLNGKTYEVKPNGEAREVPNTKPPETMEERNAKPGYMNPVIQNPKGQSPFDEGYFDDKGIDPQPYIVDPNKARG